MSLPPVPASADTILSPQDLLQASATPALLLEGEAVRANQAAETLLQDQNWLPALQHWLTTEATTQRHTSSITDPRAISSPDLKELAIEWTALPLPGAKTLLLGRDVTFEKNLTLALAESRARYKDLIEITSDCVWETDHAARFSFISPLGLLGWSPDDILGKRPHELGLVAIDALTTPFLTQKAIRDAELWLKNKQGEPRCLTVSALPRLNAAGSWVGARGLCRDITEHRQQAIELAHTRTREQITHDITRILHDSLSVDNELNAACRAMTHALSAEGTAFLRRHHGSWSLAAHYGPDIPPSSTVLAETITTLGNTLSLDSDQRSWIFGRTQDNNTVTGAIVVWQTLGKVHWTIDDSNLVSSVAEQLGTIWSDIDDRLRLKERAERDGLTGLHNQRSFSEQIDRRIAQRHESGQPLDMALVNIDLDNFKLINDTLGHDAGDNVLRRFAKKLETHVRPGDLVGRVGGDEFLIWLERVDEAIARRVAERIVQSAFEIAASLPPLSKPLGASVGVAILGQEDDFASLMHRADATMYKAKKSGKSRAEIAK